MQLKGSCSHCHGSLTSRAVALEQSHKSDMHECCIVSQWQLPVSFLHLLLCKPHPEQATHCCLSPWAVQVLCYFVNGTGCDLMSVIVSVALEHK